MPGGLRALARCDVTVPTFPDGLWGALRARGPGLEPREYLHNPYLHGLICIILSRCGPSWECGDNLRCCCQFLGRGGPPSELNPAHFPPVFMYLEMLPPQYQGGVSKSRDIDKHTR